jgi:hypothetical protein
MVAADNVRTQYQDGLVLGAAQLSGDQTYVRAALERRSLTRDMFGIAWGLELTLETAAATSPTSSLVRVTPGVAYGGDGKPIVLRDKAEVSSLLKTSGAQPSTSWAIYIAYAETAQSGQSGFSFCGQAMDPTVSEGTQFVAELSGSPLGDGERSGPRVVPQSELAGPSDANEDRVLLGVVDFDVSGQPSVRLTPGTVAIPQPAKTPTQADLLKAGAPPAQAEYIGVVASGIAHPRAWSEAAGATIVPAIELEPDGGIHLRQQTVLHGDAYATRIVLVDGTVVANAGVSMVMPVDSSIASSKPASALLQLAVAQRTDGVVPADVAVGPPAIDDTTRILGIALDAHDDAQKLVRVVFSGLAEVKLTVAPSSLTPGQWLILDSKGQLKPASASINAGTLVAKLIATVDDGAKVAKVLVCLA